MAMAAALAKMKEISEHNQRPDQTRSGVPLLLIGFSRRADSQRPGSILVDTFVFSEGSTITPSKPVLDFLRSLVCGQQYTTTADSELLRKFVTLHDGDAFTALLRRHGPMVHALAQRIVPEHAEDVFQATFLILARKAHTIRRPEALPGWLHAVALRLSHRLEESGTARSTNNYIAPQRALQKVHSTS